MKTNNGLWIGKTQFEQEAVTANIQLRTGGVCNPGGVASALALSPVEMRENFVEGVRCGNDVDEIHGKPTGIIRISLGSMSNLEDIRRFLGFLTRFAETQGGQPLLLPSVSEEITPSADELPTSKTSRQILSGQTQVDSRARLANSSTTGAVVRAMKASVLPKRMLAFPTLDEKIEVRRRANFRNSCPREPNVEETSVRRLTDRQATMVRIKSLD